MNSQQGGEIEPSTHTVAGYRIVRKLAVRADSEIYLGHSPGQESSGDGPHSVALTVYQPEASADRIEREITLRTDLEPGTVAALLDVTRLPDGRVCLVLEYLGGGTLTQVLRGKTPLSTGEAVTILAPVVTAVGRLHSAGFVLPRLGPAHILFDTTGRPVLGGLSSVEPAGDAGERTRSVRSDYGRITALLRAVFSALDSADPSARRAETLASWFESAIADVPFVPDLQLLERRLFEWSAALPLRLGSVAPLAITAPDMVRERAEPVDLLPGVLREAARVAASSTAPDVPERAGRRRSAAMTWLLQWVDWNPASAFAQWVRSMLRGRRRILLMGGVLAAAFTVVALLALSPEPTAINAAAPSATGTERANGSSGGKPQPTAEPSAAAAIAADDPVAATTALVELRAACLVAASVLCLDQVDQPGSAAHAADIYTVRLAQQGTATETNAAPGAGALVSNMAVPSLVERTGNAALVALTPSGGDSKPASLLVIKGEAGWRLREIFDY